MAKALNFACRGLYSEGVWVPASRAEGYGSAILVFVSEYEALALSAYNSGWTLWPLLPKFHLLHHTGMDLLWAAGNSQWALNPLCFSCQMAEDYIGRPSRLSRRSSVRGLEFKTMDRTLAAIESAFHELDQSR
jgi:hypothetical protein